MEKTGVGKNCSPYAVGVHLACGVHLHRIINVRTGPPGVSGDEEYAELQQFMMRNPDAGRVVPGSGGVRKLRWTRLGMGKRGGLRVIHFVRYQPNEFWMLTMYAKAKQDKVPAHILKQLLEAFRNE